MRTHRCKDPICDTHLWKVRHELDMAKMKMKRLESELEAKGIQPSPKPPINHLVKPDDTTTAYHQQVQKRYLKARVFTSKVCPPLR